MNNIVITKKVGDNSIQINCQYPTLDILEDSLPQLNRVLNTILLDDNSNSGTEEGMRNMFVAELLNYLELSQHDKELEQNATNAVMVMDWLLKYTDYPVIEHLDNYDLTYNMVKDWTLPF